MEKFRFWRRFVCGCDRNTQVTINTGKYNHIYGSGYVESPYNPAHIGGDVTVTFNDGETQILGAINDQIAGALDGVVAGSMNIVIKGGTVTAGLQSGNRASVSENVYESCTLTFDGVGNESTPYVTPMIEVLQISSSIIRLSTLKNLRP